MVEAVGGALVSERRAQRDDEGRAAANECDGPRPGPVREKRSPEAQRPARPEPAGPGDIGPGPAEPGRAGPGPAGPDVAAGSRACVVHAAPPRVPASKPAYVKHEEAVPTRGPDCAGRPAEPPVLFLRLFLPHQRFTRSRARPTAVTPGDRSVAIGGRVSLQVVSSSQLADHRANAH